MCSLSNDAVCIILLINYIIVQLFSYPGYSVWESDWGISIFFIHIHNTECIIHVLLYSIIIRIWVLLWHKSVYQSNIVKMLMFWDIILTFQVLFEERVTRGIYIRMLGIPNCCNWKGDSIYIGKGQIYIWQRVNLQLCVIYLPFAMKVYYMIEKQLYIHVHSGTMKTNWLQYYILYWCFTLFPSIEFCSWLVCQYTCTYKNKIKAHTMWWCVRDMWD